MVDNVKKQNKNTRTQFEKEISSKTELEHYLSKVVRKVKKEKEREKHENDQRKTATKFYITALDSTPNLKGNDESELNQEDRERIIELLLGKDKVISLLYDKQGDNQPMMMNEEQQLPTDEQQYFQSQEQEQIVLENAQFQQSDQLGMEEEIDINNLTEEQLKHL